MIPQCFLQDVHSETSEPGATMPTVLERMFKENAARPVQMLSLQTVTPIKVYNYYIITSILPRHDGWCRASVIFYILCPLTTILIHKSEHNLNK